MHSGWRRRRRGKLIDSDYKTPYTLHATVASSTPSTQMELSADYTHEEGNHGYRAYSYTGGVTLFSPLIPFRIPTTKPTR